MDVVLPFEVEIPSLRVLMETKLEEAEWVKARYDQLSFIEEKRLVIVCHGQLYQKRIRKHLIKRFAHESFMKGIWWLKRSYQFKRIIVVNGCLTMKVYMW